MFLKTKLCMQVACGGSHNSELWKYYVWHNLFAVIAKEFQMSKRLGTCTEQTYCPILLSKHLLSNFERSVPIKKTVKSDSKQECKKANETT